MRQMEGGRGGSANQLLQKRPKLEQKAVNSKLISAYQKKRSDIKIEANTQNQVNQEIKKVKKRTIVLEKDKIKLLQT